MRQTKILLSKENLIHNFKLINSKYPKSKLIPLVKSNAYGHGQKEIVSMLNGLDYYALGVAYTDEAVQIKSYDKKSKILIVVPITKFDIDDVVELELIPTIESMEVLVELNKKAKKANKVIEYHLFINTGMNRDGVDIFEFEKIYSNLPYLKNVKMSAIMTHFASAESEKFSKSQVNNFNSFIRHFQLDDIPQHISNSTGIFNIDNSNMNFLRPGLSLYGIASSVEERKKLGLKPVLSLKTKIKNIIQVKKSETVGYSFKYEAKDDIEVGILPIGYGDGISTSHFNKAEVIINKKKVKIIGSICMDLMMCDITDLNCKIGNEVTLIGFNDDLEITVNQWADNINVIPYEITTMLKNKISREII